ncbi:MAG: PAS domain-containing protein [Steroidobacteraceae bacterium]
MSGPTDFLVGGGEMGALMRAHDWSHSSLGAPRNWPQALRTAVRLMLNSGHPMYVFWGSDGACLYNDAYRRSIGPERHPVSLGRPAREVWDEIWDIIGPQIEQVMAGRGATWYENALVPITRNGKREDVYWTYSYSPIDDETAPAGIGGVLVVCTETTEAVESTKRLQAERQRQHELLTQMPGFVAVLTGPDHVYEYVNDAYIALAGDRNYLGRPVREMFPELEGQPFFGLLDGVYKTGKPFLARAIAVRLAGESSDRFIDLIYTAIRDAHGRITGIFVGGYDVTEAQRMAVLLQQSEARLRFIDELGAQVQQLRDADAILATTTRLVGQHMGVAVCAYAVVEDDQNHFTIRGDWTAPGLRSIVGNYRLNDFSNQAATALRAGQPLVINDRREWPPYEVSAFRELGIAATICIPLMKNGRLTALMAVHDKVPRAWTVEEHALLREVTERSWAHIERLRIELELSESERRYRALFNSIDEGFCIIEFFDGPHGPLSDYIHVAANPAYAVHAGIQNVVGQKVREMVGEEAQGWIDLYAGVLRTGEPIRFERELRATGRWLELAAFRIEPASRKQVAVIFQDLTSRKQAEVALRASEAKFRTLTRAMPNQAWTAHGDGSFDWFNERVYAYSGAELNQLDGKGWISIVHPEDVATCTARWKEALRLGETFEAQLRLRRADGVWRWHIARAVPIKTTAGEVVRWIGTNTDIHEQKEANETLEQRVSERTSQLMQAEEALRQSQKMEAIGQLTGGIAHDFNNLLGGISGSLELLDRRLAEGRIDSLPRYISAAQEGSRRAASLTQRLLAFSRRQTLDPKPLDANRLIAGMEELIRRTVGPTIEVEVVGAGGLWATRVDPSQLESALLNLCINARDAMASQGGRLTIETANKWLDERAARARELLPGQYISICVTDTGTGMTPEVIARAFDPFFTTKPIGQGTGLGLSMIYGFVRQSNGQVRIYSEVGKGTTMCLYLPRYVGAADQPDDLVNEQSIELGHGETVLVIDDEPILRMLALDVLNENGYRVLEAIDGPSGLKILQSDVRVDLLVTDVGLPGGLNGRQVADAARLLRPDLKVLFITGYAENAVIGNGHLEHGMELMTKPFPVAALVQKVCDMLER